MTKFYWLDLLRILVDTRRIFHICIACTYEFRIFS